MIELYRHDFSEFDGCDLNELGKYGYRYLDHYWTEEDRHPFILYVDGKVAGFVLVNTIGNTRESDYFIGEFCVLRKYRGKGIGKKVAFAIFDRFPGVWEVATHIKNTPAIAFWQKVIEDYSEGSYKMYSNGIGQWEGPIWVFRNRHTDPDKSQLIGERKSL